MSGLGLLVSGLGLIFAALELLWPLLLRVDEALGGGHCAPVSSFRTFLNRGPEWHRGILCPSYLAVTRAVRDRTSRLSAASSCASYDSLNLGTGKLIFRSSYLKICKKSIFAKISDFDNLLLSMMNIFEAITLEGWTDMM